MFQCPMEIQLFEEFQFFVWIVHDKMRYTALIMLIILQGLLYVRYVNDFGLFTLEYISLSIILKIISYKNDKCHALTLPADQLAYSVYSISGRNCKIPSLATEIALSATVSTIEPQCVVNTVKSKFLYSLS